MEEVGLNKFFVRIYGICFVFFLFFGKAQITVDNTTYTDQELVEKFIGTKNLSCVAISNVSITGGNIGGGDSSYGYFTKGRSNFTMDEGIILSTGNVLAAPGPKTKSTRIQSITANNWFADPDLAIAMGKPVSEFTDATILEFDFSTTISDKISFRYMFLSEEYYPGNYNYSDAFAFLIKESGSIAPYKNIALVPGTAVPVSVTTINARDNKKYFDAFTGFNSSDSGTNDSPTNFNGQTKILTAGTNVIPGVLYHIKLVIADQKNYEYDSAVFLEAGSFTGNIDLLPNKDSDDSAIICVPGVDVTLEQKNPVSDTGAKYYWYQDGVDLKLPTTQKTYDTHIPGEYRLKVELSSGCTLTGNVRVENAPIAIVDTSPIAICDADFDGVFAPTLSDYNFQILKNFSRDFKTSFYTSAGVKIDENKPFPFSNNPETIMVQIGAFNCSPKSYPIQFYHGAEVSMNYPKNVTPTFDICDDDLDGFKDVSLTAIVDNKMTNVIGTSKTFYKTESEAKKGATPTVTNLNPKLSPTNSDVTYWVRLENTVLGSCPNYSSFRLLFKQPKKSTVLKDTIICKGTFANLDAGTGLDPITGKKFTSYNWSNGATTQIVKNLPAGDYWVDLGFNDCVYRQPVRISEPRDLEIDNVLIEGNKITIQASNGLPSYQYFLDGNRLSSNVKENVEKGKHTVEVRDQCGSVFRTFYIINEKNVITPNDDGRNDVIDYSDLRTKSEPKFEVYDRNGNLVFKGSPDNQYIWNGKLNGRPLPTASYWYILEWNETGNPNMVQKTGWILLKNRNSD
jgi:hypothetical protein